MAAPRLVPQDHPPFAALPVQHITVQGGNQQLAVHASGRFAAGRLPVICVPGYQRNMSDFTDFVPLLRQMLDRDWPVVLIDLLGRGRSTDRARVSDYASPNDARDIAAVTDALGITRAILIGQSYGGQVVMALCAERPTLCAGTVLIDAGPVSDPNGLVRMRNNFADLGTVRGKAPFQRMSRQMLSADYPGANEAHLDRLVDRVHFVDGRGRVQALFDPRLMAQLKGFEHDDVLVAQWPLFDMLAGAPLLLMRAQLTGDLRRDTFEEMMRRRRDAPGFIIEAQGSPALLDHVDDVRPIADLVRAAPKWKRRRQLASA